MGAEFRPGADGAAGVVQDDDLDRQIFFGPFYAFAIYAFTRGREWIRNWSLLWAATMMTNVTIIMGEEFWGEHATDHRAMVAFANAS